MRINQIILILFLSYCIFSCNKDESLIKKDLNSRYIKYEIVEIRNDSANIHKALNVLRSLKIRVAENNAKVSKTLYEIESHEGDKTEYQNYLYIDSLHKSILKSMTDFEESGFDRPDPCYFVKYLIPKNEKKVPVEEFYYISKDNGDILHRPYDWKEFLYEQQYNELIKEALKHEDDIFKLEWKFRK